MTIRRRALPADPAANALAAFLAREELAFRCLRRRLGGTAGPGPAAAVSGTLSGFPEPGGSRSEA
jgi:hypothetical protein